VAGRAKFCADFGPVALRMMTHELAEASAACLHMFTPWRTTRNAHARKQRTQTHPPLRRTFQVNALAVIWTTKAFLPAMLERNSGHIVTVSSMGESLGMLVGLSCSPWLHGSQGASPTQPPRSGHGRVLQNTVMCALCAAFFSLGRMYALMMGGSAVMRPPHSLICWGPKDGGLRGKQVCLARHHGCSA